MSGVFLQLLLAVTIMTGLIVQVIKMILDEKGVKYHSNIIALVVAVIMAVLIFFAYVILQNMVITPQVIVYLIALIILSCLCSMLGYDKVIQTLAQLKS